MESTGGGDDKGIDARAGGLVWVRRRNGSWWPGKILSPEEVPDGCTATPRTGTPVKLLGKNGAAVDWYNLEKSKRVKAFHCGEYEDCIAKAKVSASHLSKKKARKARREDAILLALELEAALLGKDHSKASAMPDLENRRGSGPTCHSTSGEDSDIDREENNLEISETEKLKTSNDSEEDAAGVKKRMRGLEDLGVGVPSSLKRKRSLVTHESLKRKNRRRPLIKVLQCSTMLSSPLEQFPSVNGHAHAVPPEIKVSESQQSVSVEIKNEADCIGFLYGNGTLKDVSMEAGYADQQHVQKDDDSFRGQDGDESSQSLFDVPVMSEDVPPDVCDASQRAQIGASQSSLVESLSFGSEEKTRSGSASCIAPFVHQSGLNSEKSSSDWQKKGKRNSRARKLDTDEENQKESTAASQRLLPHRPSRYTVNPKYDSANFPLRRHSPDSCLYDVVVEVKSSYRPQHVPYISLMSKMNNLPITGHPLTVEVLEDGSCCDLVARHSNGSDVESGLPVDEQQQQQQTGRRLKSGRSRKNGLLSKKIRKLSTLTASRGCAQEAKKPVVEKLRRPSIACVPLKVVFSRINAALSSSYRPPAPRLGEDADLKC